MDKNEVLVDIRDLGKRETIVKLYDPYAANEKEMKYTVIRLVKMSPGESKQCFQASKEAYQKELLATQEDEKKNKTFDTLVNSMTLDEVINQLIAIRRISLEATSDLIEVPDDDKLTDEQLEAKQKEKIDEWEKQAREEIKTKPEAELRKQYKDIIMESPAGNAQNRAFAERALAYMCYHKDKDERVFSTNPDDDNYITKVIRDELIYAQLQAAYYRFTDTFRISAKEIRKQTMRGGDFFTCIRSASNTEKSHSTMN
ncbi:MAG: hypothetical protein PHW65_03085 [Dehalococcoidales bacterium]|nr:hypothetical protein [Dehalococcoidales bacterium]